MTSHTDPSELTDTTSEAELNHLLGEHMVPVAPAPRLGSALANRLQERISQSIAQHSRLLTVRAKHGVWQPLKKGIRFKMLWEGVQGNSVLVEIDPGASLPEHRHNWLEEGLILRGGIQVGELELGEMDYHATPPGSRHSRISSRQGALAYLRGTSLGHTSSLAKELLGGLLPVGKNQAQTVFAYEADGWEDLAPGVYKKNLQTDGILSSFLVRMEPNSTCFSHSHSQNEECMILRGEVFLGDILLQGGEYQLAPVGSVHGKIYTDVGALLFIRGPADYSDSIIQ